MKQRQTGSKTKFYLLFLLLVSTLTVFSQGSATIKVTHTPGRTLVKGKSIWVIPNWQLTSSSKSNCYSFLEYKVFVKADYGGTELKYKIEVINKSPFNVAVSCSGWGGGTGGRSTVRSGNSYSAADFKFPNNNNRIITIENVNFEFNSSDKQKHGISKSLSDYLNCGETASSYINKLKAIDKNKQEIETLKNDIRALSSNSEAELIQKIGLLKKLQRIDKNRNYNSTISSLENKLQNLKKQNSQKKEPEKPATKYSKDFSDNSSSSNKNTSNNNNSNTNKKGNQNTSNTKYQNNTNRNSNNNNNNKSRPETFQQKQARIKRDKRNKEVEENNRKYEIQQKRIAANKRYHKKMEALSRDAMSKFDQAAQGDLMAAGIMKGTYAIALASQGYTDKNAIVGAAANIIGGIMQNAERKRAEEARQAAIAAEKRKREAAKRKFIAKLVRNRRLTINRMPIYAYPSFLTNEASSSVFFFAILANEQKLKEDLPEIKITDLIEISRYSDGTWPFENGFKEKLRKYGNHDIRIVGAFTDYRTASRKLEQLIKGFAENGVKIKLINAAKDFIIEKRENSATANSSNKNGFWGTSISENGKETKKIETKKGTEKEIPNTKKEVSIANENGFWGKSITLEKKKTPILAVKKKEKKTTKKKETKKKDFWGKSIKVENKKDSTSKKKKIKKGF